MRSIIAAACLVGWISLVWAGTGTLNDPYTIAEARSLSTGPTEYYAQGYIVGGRYDDFDTPWDNDYGISCADSDSETDVDNCLQVKLESDGGRATWGLNSNPGKKGTLIKFKGYRDTYGGKPSFEGCDNADISEVTGGGASNEPPSLAVEPSSTNKTVTASNLLSFVITATEIANDASDTITLRATNLPSGATFSQVSGTTPLTNTFTWTPLGTQTGQYTVAFLAGDEDGTNTLNIRITVNSNGGAAVTYYAVICGISDYEGSINDLDYCDDDAEDLYAKLLESPHWQAGNMQLLTDSQATEANIQSAISTMGSNADDNDICLFYFSGHGDYVDDESPYDEGDGYDELLCPYYLQSNEILDDELSNWLDGLPTDNIIVWIDTCFSGGNLKTSLPAGRKIKCLSVAGDKVLERGDGFIDDFEPSRNRDVNDLTAPYISTASDDDEYSYEDPDIQHGIYTYYLLEALDNGDTDFDNWVSAEETFDYLYSRVVAMESTQHPQEYDNYSGEAEVVSTNISGPMNPSVVITVPSGDLTVNYSNSTVDVSGTCNTATVGQLSWTNPLTGGNGTRSAATSWSINGVALGVGVNVITVRGTNDSGSSAGDSISITRRSETSGNVLIDEDFDDSTDAPAGWTDNGSANDTVATHCQSSPNCRALGAGDTLDTPAVNYPVEISFYVDSSNGGDGNDGNLAYKIGDGSWVTFGTFTVSKVGATEVYDLTSDPDLSASESVMFRFSSSFYTWYLDDVLILGAAGGTDDDSDYMPNWWENLHSGGNTNLDAQTDNDGDGCNNLHEWIADCNPTSKVSVFEFRAHPAPGPGDDIIIRWRSASNRLYDIWWSTVVQASAFAIVESNITATPPENAYTDTVHGTESELYYRIDVKME